jgi:flagellar biosynthetic protein FlhB
MSAEHEGRTEKATPRKRGRLRDEGKVVVSREVISLAVLLASGVALVLALPAAGEELALLCRIVLGGLDRVGEGGPEGWTAASLGVGTAILLPVGIASSAGALCAGFAQTRGLFTLKALRPRFAQLANPLPQLRRLLVSKEALVTILQSAFKVAVIVAATWHLFWSEMQALSGLSGRPLAEGMTRLLSALTGLGARVIVVLVLFAVIDYLLVHRRMEESMKMTKQELKDEARESDGDPEIKRRQRMRAREILRNQMLHAVTRADVVVVNPTHFAVALRYDAAMPAPQVVAKGRDEVAARIREVARSHRVPIVHNPPLARLLHAEVAVGRPIPIKLFAAVAEVLAYVYRLRGGSR